MNHIVWQNFSGLKFNGESDNSIKNTKSQYFRRYEDFFNMYCKIFVQQIRNNLKPDNTCYDLFCAVNMKMALVEQEITP